MNRGDLWETMRAALAGYPELQSRVPGGPGPVDALPQGGQENEISGRDVTWQGTFIGPS